MPCSLLQMSSKYIKVIVSIRRINKWNIQDVNWIINLTFLPPRCSNENKTQTQKTQCYLFIRGTKLNVTNSYPFHFPRTKCTSSAFIHQKLALIFSAAVQQEQSSGVEGVGSRWKASELIRKNCWIRLRLQETGFHVRRNSARPAKTLYGKSF